MCKRTCVGEHVSAQVIVHVSEQWYVSEHLSRHIYVVYYYVIAEECGDIPYETNLSKN
jgi:hypothetical protein